jgi:O-antigen ligase
MPSFLRLPGDGANWPVAVGLGLAGLAGIVAGGGDWQLAVAVALIPAFVIVATAAPERTALGLIVLLPFMIYPASVGDFSIFLAVPLFGYTSIVLLTRQRGGLAKLRRDLPVLAFAILLAIAVATATAAIEPTTAFSRVTYLALFGLFAFALATSLANGRLTRRDVAKAMLLGAGIAGACLLFQFFAQFASGEGTVMDWLFDNEGLFAGERAAAVRKSNWVVQDLDLLRGIFPFMTPPSAGQFMMFGLIAGMWLRRERRGSGAAGSTLELILLLLVAAALLATFSRQAWLGAIIGVVALSMERRRLGALAAVVGLIMVVSLLPVPGSGGSFGSYLLSGADTSTESTDTRLDLWEQAVALIPENAVVGVGPGLIETLKPGTSDRPYYAHNIVLDGAVEIGIAGVAALIAVFVLGLRAALRRRAALAFALLAAYVVAGLFDDVFYFPRNGILLAVAFALIAGVDSRDAERRREPEAAPG